MYALFKDGKQVSKEHSTKRAVIIEAFESGITFVLKGEIYILEGYAIEEVKE